MTIQTNKLKTRVRGYELSAFGKFIIASYENDQKLFKDYSEGYSTAHLLGLKTDQLAIEALVNPVQIMAELKVISNRLYSNQSEVTKQINFLEGYVKRASGLTIAMKDFGFHAVRAANQSGNMQKLVDKLGIVTVNAQNNLAALILKGYSAAKQATLIALMNQMDTDNGDQNKKINERMLLVESNHGIMNTFWDNMVDVCDAGKRIFKPVSEEKKQEYVITSVISRLRGDVKKTSVTGEVEPKARIEFISTSGGRKRVVYANPKGAYSLIGAVPGDYLALKIVKGKPNMSKNVTIETNVPKVENF